MPGRPRPLRRIWILVPLGLGTLLALAILLFGDARHAEAADLGIVTDAVSSGVSATPAPTQPVADVVAPVVETVDPVVALIVDPVVGVVAPVVDPVVGVVAPVVDPVLDVVAPVVTPITDVVDPPIPAGPVIHPVLAPVVGIVDPVATPVVEPLIRIVGHVVVPPIGGASLLPTRATSGAQLPDAPSGTALSSTRSDTASLTIDPAYSPSGLPTPLPGSSAPFAPLSSSTSASGGVPFQLLLFAVGVVLAAFLGPRARRLLLIGAITPRFALVSLTERPG